MKVRILALAVISALFFHSLSARAQGTAFTYQGELDSNAVAANGNFDFQFGLYTNVTTGNFIGTLVTNANTAVSNGLFTTTLSFGNVFSGAAYWLEIGVRTNGSTGAFAILSPRQPITPTPYAITAGNASNVLGTVPASQLSGPLPATSLTGTYSNTVSFTNTGNVFSGNGAGLTGLVTPTGSNYLFATDSTVQYITTADAFQTITFNTVSINSGWTAAPNGMFTAGQTGLYLVQYQVHVQNGGQNYSAFPNIAFGIRGVLNSALELAGSESIVDIPPAFGIGILSRSFLLGMTGGQTLTFQITANVAGPYEYMSTLGNYSYIVSGSFAAENYPGASLTIVRIQ